MAILIWLKLLLFVHFCSSYFVIYCGCFVLHRYCRLQLFPIIVTILSAHPFLFMAPPFLPFIHPVKMTYQSGPELESGQYGHLSDPVFGDHLGGGSGGQCTTSLTITAISYCLPYTMFWVKEGQLSYTHPSCLAGSVNTLSRLLLYNWFPCRMFTKRWSCCVSLRTPMPQDDFPVSLFSCQHYIFLVRVLSGWLVSLTIIICSHASVAKQLLRSRTPEAAVYWDYDLISFEPTRPCLPSVTSLDIYELVVASSMIWIYMSWWWHSLW